MTLEELRHFKPQIMAIAARYGVSNIRVFGSVARGDSDENSDVDLLIDMEDGSLFDLMYFKRDIETFLKCKADVGMRPNPKNPVRFRRIMREATPL